MYKLSSLCFQKQFRGVKAVTDYFNGMWSVCLFKLDLWKKDLNNLRNIHTRCVYICVCMCTQRKKPHFSCLGMKFIFIFWNDKLNALPLSFSKTPVLSVSALLGFVSKWSLACGDAVFHFLRIVTASYWRSWGPKETDD